MAIWTWIKASVLPLASPLAAVHVFFAGHFLPEYNPLWSHVKASIRLLLFYTTQKVYTKFGMVSILASLALQKYWQIIGKSEVETQKVLDLQAFFHVR